MSRENVADDGAAAGPEGRLGTDGYAGGDGAVGYQGEGWVGYPGEDGLGPEIG